MTEQWSDNAPGWEDRLRAHLKDIGIDAAKRELEDNFYRPDKLPRKIAEAWVSEADKRLATERDDARIEVETGIAQSAADAAWWSFRISVLSLGVSVCALIVAMKVGK